MPRKDGGRRAHLFYLPSPCSPHKVSWRQPHGGGSCPCCRIRCPRDQIRHPRDWIYMALCAWAVQPLHSCGLGPARPVTAAAAPSGAGAGVASAAAADPTPWCAAGDQHAVAATRSSRSTRHTSQGSDPKAHDRIWCLHGGGCCLRSAATTTGCGWPAALHRNGAR